MNEIVRYTAGTEEVTLSPQIVRNYLVSGGGAVTDQEVMAFLMLCKAQHLNPFLRDAYLIKYGNQAANVVTGKGTFLKRAAANPDYDGKESGIVVRNRATGAISERKGAFWDANTEEILGGWARVYTKSRSKPEFSSVSFGEYAGRRRDGSLNGQWETKPATMIQKVAVVQALREAFPDEFSGLYSAEEMGDVSAYPLPENPVTVTTQPEAMPEEPMAPEEDDEMPPEDAPVIVLCKDCGKALDRETTSDGKPWPMKDIVEYSSRNCGRPLCRSCLTDAYLRAVAERKRQQQPDSGAADALFNS